MGQKTYGVMSGTLQSGGEYFTNISRANDKVRMATGHALLVAVSSAIAAATGSATGSISAGWMSSGTVAVLSASYASSLGI